VLPEGQPLHERALRRGRAEQVPDGAPVHHGHGLQDAVQLHELDERSGAQRGAQVGQRHR